MFFMEPLFDLPEPGQPTRDAWIRLAKAAALSVVLMLVYWAIIWMTYANIYHKLLLLQRIPS